MRQDLLRGGLFPQPLHVHLWLPAKRRTCFLHLRQLQLRQLLEVQVPLKNRRIVLEHNGVASE